MEFLSLHSPPLKALPSSSAKVFVEKSCFLSGQTLPLPNIKRCPHARNLRCYDSRARPSGISESNAGTAKAIRQEMQPQDDNVAFVAGATGRVGSRAVRELLKLGFRVKAAVRNAQKAETLVQSVREMKIDDPANTAGIPPVERLEIVECDLEKPKEIRPAIDNASIVLCCIGASEKEVFDVTGPYRIDYLATKNLIDAANVAKVNHFILLTSLGTNKIGFPAAILNLFWGVLIWKRKAEEALIASGIPYTIVRPGGMERPTDAYKETHNLVLANEDTLFGGQVSNLQVAELMAFMAKNRSLSYCKVVEVIAETTAPRAPMGELLARIPSQRVDKSPLKEVKTDSKPDPGPSTSTMSEPTTTIAEKEPTQTEVQKTAPLSPYTAYDDLKPPTSPSPTPSTTPSDPKESILEVVQVKPETRIEESQPPGSTVEEKLAQAEVQRTQPLSPYVAYEDLKPPTSPTPTPSSSSDGVKGRPADAAAPLGLTPPFGVGIGEASTVSTLKSNHLSPYQAYGELKPPTTPSPNAPVSFTSETNINASKPGVYQQKKSRPLSPYTMYEDLKPPTTPTPSPKG